MRIAAASKRRVQQPSWILFPSIISPTPAWVDWSDLFVAYWGRLEEGYFRGSAPPLKMAATAAIVDLVSVDYLTPGSTGMIFVWLFGSDWRKVHFDGKRRRSFNMATMASVLDLISVHYLV
jgi:hypothetical protein